MALPVLVKLGVPAAVAAYFFFAGDGDGERKRKPWRDPIKVPGNDEPWTAYDDAICHCYEAGEHDSVALVNCALSRVHPEIEWPARAVDHISVMRTWQAVGHRVATFLALPADKRAAACATAPPPPEGPTEPTDIDVPSFFGDAPGKLAVITGTHNQNPSYTMHNVYGIPYNSANIGRALMANVNSIFNLTLYSRRVNNGTFGARKIGNQYYDIGAAWNPVNNRVRVAAEAGTKLLRGVGWGGNQNVGGDDDAYGSPFMVPTHEVNGILVADHGDYAHPANNPPAEFLARIGWTIETLKAAWEANNAH